ncbi:hypothetical protein ANOM_005366 [Aspergillus nomiae NRRL 13137]|uniref:Rhodopsin domain-containing protein n=1 Tax=Aspergillus nomiae NRRL (strain ATCC 15546 / NRRL 13137 / CBS 260.88 / M93) TaxID=1509407 RepID=A0A0L1J5C7_ASPN3|nr:uncharacterized protein ANOM_005366 [Aspergillus nomiae NRRL 13137]KNG86927.1 hypothetical protein ANOM_005366 [Aspergillus nomiae NRRL 13137]
MADSMLMLHAKVSKGAFLGVLWAFTATDTIFVLFRIFVRIAFFRRLFVDDFFVLLAWAIMLTNAIIWQIQGQVLYKLYAISAGQESYTPAVLPMFESFMRYIAPMTIMFYSGLWAIKFSFMSFFFRLDSKVKSHRIWWYVVLVVIGGVYVASVADVDYRCSLGGIEFIITKCSDLDHVHYQNRTFWANCVGDIVTDILILSIPILILWNTRISLRKKLILFGIFSATILVMAVAIIRVVVNNSLNSSVDIGWLYFWSFVEMGTGIIIACIASFRQLFVSSQNQHLFGKVKHTPQNPLLGVPSKKYGLSRERSDTESQTSDAAIVPMDSVHVRSDFEVVTSSKR